MSIETPKDATRVGMLQPGKRVIATMDNWFYGPDGRQYRSVFGTVIGVFTDSDTLGIRTNARSANWYAQIGGMVIAGCQIHYVAQASNPPPDYVPDWSAVDGKCVEFSRPSGCLDADAVAVAAKNGSGASDAK